MRVYDALVPQVHGERRGWPAYLQRARSSCCQGDVRDGERLGAALAGVDGVFHLAARVGVGQSMYEIEDYVAANELGTATLLQLLSQRPVERLVVASSMSIYGEGLYRDAEGRTVQPGLRGAAQLRAQRWEPQRRARPAARAGADARGQGARISPRSTRSSKYAQERMCLIVGEAYGIETVALRLFNVFGSRQALSNPYTGVLAIFAARLLNGRPPPVFEDGLQRRDFVHVKDVARAFHLAMTMPAGGAAQVLNVGSGRAYTVAEVGSPAGARPSAGRSSTPEITGKHRAGDIRHCFADISRAASVLGFSARASARDRASTSWSAGSTGRAAEDRVGRGDRGARAAGAGGMSAAAARPARTGRRSASSNGSARASTTRVEAAVADLRAPRRAPPAHRHLLGRLSSAGRRAPGTTGCCRRSRAHFELLPCVLYVPPSLSRSKTTAGPPEDPKAYADFLDVLVTRHGRHFAAIELWNEPNNLADWDWRLDPQWQVFAEMIVCAAHWMRRAASARCWAACARSTSTGCA